MHTSMQVLDGFVPSGNEFLLVPFYSSGHEPLLQQKKRPSVCRSQGILGFILGFPPLNDSAVLLVHRALSSSLRKLLPEFALDFPWTRFKGEQNFHANLPSIVMVSLYKCTSGKVTTNYCNSPRTS